MGLRAVGLAIAAIAVSATVLTAPRAAAESSTPPARGRCAVKWVTPPPGPRAAISNILFLNRCPGGCVITKGTDDARADRSSIPDIASGATATLTEWNHGDEVWDATVACVREVLAPYDIVVTDQDPGSQSHHESMVAGNPTELGWDSSIAGVSPMAPDCRPLDNIISFAFANAYGDDDPLEHCWTIVHEAGHAYGLEHVLECRDPMTYLTSCGQKFFRNHWLECAAEGDFNEPWAEAPCRCNALQNSHQKLLDVFGPGAGAPPPETTIELPAENAQVRPGFVVYTTASDPRGVEHIKLYANGAQLFDLSVDPYDPGPHALHTPMGLSDGYLDIEARAFTDLEIPGSASVTVLKGEPCTSAAACAVGQSCSDGRCVWPPPSAAVGEPCNRSSECLSELCPERDGLKMCTTWCEVDEQCQSGMACADDGICWLTDDAGCCAVTGGGRSPWPSGFLVALVLGVLLRRRR